MPECAQSFFSLVRFYFSSLSFSSTGHIVSLQ